VKAGIKLVLKRDADVNFRINALIDSHNRADEAMRKHEEQMRKHEEAMRKNDEKFNRLLEQLRRKSTNGHNN